MKQYEYNVITNDTPLQEKILNKLGMEGWSLSSHTYSHFPNTPDRHVYTFKRGVASIQNPAVLDTTKDTILAKDALIRELRKGYVDMALIIEQLTTKDLTEEDIKDMRERADRLKESIK